MEKENHVEPNRENDYNDDGDDDDYDDDDRFHYDVTLLLPKLLSFPSDQGCI